ncbi:MAG: hypothetical protein ACK5L6_10590, partial [Anaerorhabdus sp.]|uniref:hypothetical protein n=1 Tax=Anaerorhabdus sp. TaxID=1872524 RepID=UPI003A8BB34A
MKKTNILVKATVGTVVLMAVLFLACSKDFDEVVLDDFDFSFSAGNPENGFLFEKTRTDFSLVPEKDITTVGYFMNFSFESGKGYFLTMEGDTLRERDTLKITEK